MNINMALNRTAFFLIAILLVLITLSAIIPQQDIASGQILDWQELLGDNYAIIENLGLDRIYYTPFFFIVLALLGLNLVWGHVRRFRLIYKTKSEKFRLRYIGSIIFHLSLLVIITGVILNFLYKYEGVLALTEGQQATDRPADYFREFKGPLYRGTYDNFSIKLDELRQTYEGSELFRTAAFRMTPSGSKELPGEISVNYPYEWEDAELHLGQQAGYSPEALLLDNQDSILFKAFMRLAVIREDDQDVHRDFVIITSEDLRLEVEVLALGASGDEFQYPTTVYRDEVLLYEGTLTPGDTAYFEDRKLTFPRIRHWCYIGVIRGPYLGLVFFGFWTCLGGMAVGLISRILPSERKI
jgi:hypothetical protein